MKKAIQAYRLLKRKEWSVAEQFIETYKKALKETMAAGVEDWDRYTLLVGQYRALNEFQQYLIRLKKKYENHQKELSGDEAPSNETSRAE